MLTPHCAYIFIVESLMDSQMAVYGPGSMGNFKLYNRGDESLVNVLIETRKVGRGDATCETIKG